MARITQNKQKKWVAEVSKKNPIDGLKVRKKRTFNLKKDAQKWAASFEQIIERGELEIEKKKGKTLSELLTTYVNNVSTKKQSVAWESKKITFLKTLPISNKSLTSITKEDISRWRDDRLLVVQPESLRREWTVLNSVFNYGINDLGWLDINPMNTVKKPPKGKPRTAIFSDEDLEKAVFVSGYSADRPPLTKIAKVCASLLLAVETAIRSKELSQITWDMVKPDRISMPGEITKNGLPRTVPLTSKARAIVDQFREIRDGDMMLNITSTDMTNHFRKIRMSAELDGLTFRDSRATALTKLAKVFENPMELAKISGHQNLSILLNTYYRPSEDSLVEKMAAL